MTDHISNNDVGGKVGQTRALPPSSLQHGQHWAVVGRDALVDDADLSGAEGGGRGEEHVVDDGQGFVDENVRFSPAGLAASRARKSDSVRDSGTSLKSPSGA